MNKTSYFNLGSWLKPKHSSTHSSAQTHSPSAPAQQQHPTVFDPSRYLNLSESGRPLLSKPALRAKELFDSIVEDAKKQVEQMDFTPSLKRDIYQEFLSCTKKNSPSLSSLSSATSFFNHLSQNESPYQEELKSFKNIFATRIATLYFLKIRFLSKLNHALEQNTEEPSLYNPSASLAKIFRNGSSSELSSPAITSNHYSWYHPSSKITPLIKTLKDITLDEWQEIFFTNNGQNPKTHALAHPDIGAFLIKLTTKHFLPQDKKNKPHSIPLSPWLLPGRKDEWVLTTKYCGDDLYPLFCSHWLARAQAVARSRSLSTPIVCPEFSQLENSNQKFLQLTCELFFLSALVERAVQQQSDPVSFICKIYHFKKDSQCCPQSQKALFGSDVMGDTDFFYDRIILNITQFPSNNPQNFLIKQIQQQGKKLKTNGQIIVLSAQKLFLPSLADRAEDLLKNFKLQSTITLKYLVGRGEIPPYIYILSQKAKKHLSGKSPFRDQASFASKASPMNHNDNNDNDDNKSDDSNGDDNKNIKKHPCLSFRIKGTLETLSQFSAINQEFDEFFKNKTHQAIPIYHKDLASGLSFEFYPDAMIDGHLVHTTNKDTSKITHPNFLKNLMNSCRTMKHFFHIEPLKEDHNHNPEGELFPRDLLGISQNPEDRFPAILIFDYRKKRKPRLEFIPSCIYQEKFNNYGQDLCSYFGLIPKVGNINIDLFHYFFQSPLGQQILFLSLNEEYTYLRSKLSSLLVPKFFEQNDDPPQALKEKVNFYQWKKEDILNLPIEKLRENYKKAENNILELISEHPRYAASLSTLFDQTLTATEQKESSHEHCFFNKNFIRSIVKQPAYPIYPSHKDIFLNFQPAQENSEQLYEPLENIKITEQHDMKEQCSTLELYTLSGLALTIHSQDNLIKFLAFIINGNAMGRKIIDIIQKIKVPELKNLDEIIIKHEQSSQAIKEIKKSNLLVLKKVINNQLYY